ncbi:MULTISPECIES: LacI family DNA-binding transcriptional regulator [unclassified Jeotgalibaca]|uniref:LacI family DNA-binding transcriptional regulator n=1 Tax=unclassified Jeotgalibaca TaxID=2621505 RepID=UPI003FD17E98
MPTLNDVAKLANVSKMTVSRVINHPEQVTEELRNLVHKAMVELDYRPNKAAKALAQNRTLIVKVMILEELDTTDPYFMNLLIGIASELDKNHYALQLITQDSTNKTECDGYIIMGMREKDYTWIKEIPKPVVLFGENDYGVTYVDSNNVGGTAKATEFAISRGYEKITFVGIDVADLFERSREKGYLETMKAAGMETEILRFDNHSTPPMEYFRENLHRYPENTCFVCGSDRLALGVENGIHQTGKSVPTDYGVIGFDGVLLDQIALPKLTTIKQDVRQMGELCAQIVLRKIQFPDEEVESIEFDTQLIIRESTK